MAPFFQGGNMVYCDKCDKKFEAFPADGECPVCGCSVCATPDEVKQPTTGKGKGKQDAPAT
jgi:rRNA maturation endonuclease Nob1